MLIIMKILKVWSTEIELEISTEHWSWRWVQVECTKLQIPGVEYGWVGHGINMVVYGSIGCLICI